MQIDTSEEVESSTEETSTNVNMMYELNEDIENENKNASN
jgi:hypothetical protein